MAFAHGKNCEVVAGEFDLTPFFRDSAVAASKDMADSTTFRNDWKTFLPGIRSSTVELDGLYDPTITEEIFDKFDTDLVTVTTVGPAGLKAGDLAYLVNVHQNGLVESSPVGDVVAMQWSLMSTDEVFHGYALKDLEVAVTTDGTGTGVDTAAAVTSASWCFHYHLMVIDVGSVVITVEDSADGSTDWQPITSVTSGLLTAAGSGRVTGTGNVRRYLRVAYDLTTATFVTFTAAFARHA